MKVEQMETINDTMFGMQDDVLARREFLRIIKKTEKASTKEDIIDVLYSYDKYLVKYPNSLSSYVNRSNALQQLGLYELALEDLNYVLKKIPNMPLVWCGKSFILNLLGDYKAGWAAYEWRWQTPVAYPKEKDLPIPRWKGEEIGDDPLIIYAEQGLGDNIQFVRFVIEAHMRGFNIYVANHKEIEDFIGENLEKLGIKVAYNGEQMSNIRCYTSMMSLPFLFGTTVDTIPYSDKYLEVNDKYKKKWQELLGEKKKKRIGIVWAGSPTHARNKYRSIPFEKISKLFEINNENIEFHCLQKSILEEDLEKIENYENLFTWQDKLDSFSDTAGLISQLDLVITIDTSVAHLSGALGHKTWIMLTYHPDFRWLLNREDSPWYKSVKLFRQNEKMDWDTVIENIKKELEENI